MYLYILSELPVYENYKGFSDKQSYNRPIIIYSVFFKMYCKVGSSNMSRACERDFLTFLYLQHALTLATLRYSISIVPREQWSGGIC